MKYLSLYYDSPLQSWGIQGKWDNRRTEDFPTKSAISGQFFNALSIKDNEKLKRFNELSLYSVILKCKYNIVRDFQTITPSENGLILKNAKGKPHTSTIVRRKSYLADTITGAILTGDDALIDEIKESFLNPKNVITLGRYCCLPSESIFNSIDNTGQDALASLIDRVNKVRSKFKLDDNSIIRVVYDYYQSDYDYRLNDVILDFDKRKFLSRLVKDEEGTFSELKDKIF